MKSFRFSRKHSFFVIFVDAPTLKLVRSTAKETSYLGQKTHFQVIVPFHGRSTAKLPSLAVLRKFKLFLHKPIYFFENQNIGQFGKTYYFRCTSQYFFYNLLE